MTFDEALKLKNNSPAILNDGKMALLVRLWEEKDMLGFQVPEEENIRWLPVSNIHNLGGGALIEKVM